MHDKMITSHEHVNHATCLSTCGYSSWMTISDCEGWILLSHLHWINKLFFLHSFSCSLLFIITQSSSASFNSASDRPRHLRVIACTILYKYKYKIQIQILYSLRITTCNQHEVHNLTRLFCYNNTKWLIDLGREKSQF